jgi:hypothetical protein
MLCSSHITPTTWRCAVSFTSRPLYPGNHCIADREESTGHDWFPSRRYHFIFLNQNIVRRYVTIYLRLYSPLLDLGRFFSFLILYTVGRTPWAGISMWHGRYLHTEQHKHRINAHRHPCHEWDSNPRSQRSSERK